jgi:pSer/pThr/pTyr-binding forkhead associated (FHA) protein
VTKKSAQGEPTISLRSDAQEYPISRIVVVDGVGKELSSVVLSSRHVRIGTSPANDVVLDDPHASRFHCEIRVTDDGYLLRDLGSTNGTRVGELEVREAVLRHGATIEVGETRLRFLADEGRPEEIAASKSEHFGRVAGKSVRMREVFGVL